MKVAVVDYGMGNLHSVLKSAQAVNDIGAEIFLTSEPEAVLKADKVIFPGQGAMPDCMRELHQHGLAEAIRESTKNKPFLASASARSYCSRKARRGRPKAWACFPARWRVLPPDCATPRASA